MPVTAEATMAYDYKQGYQRGYFRGSRCYWPEHRPPTPPEPVVAALMNALRDLRDTADSLCATLDDNDDFVKRLAPRIDAADAAMSRVGQWLLVADAAAAE